MDIHNEASHKISIDHPADTWKDGFPLGNGTLGAMVLGGVLTERVAINHEALWRGLTRDRSTKQVSMHLQEIRDCFIDGRLREGSALARRHLSGLERRVQPYQPAGDLILEFSGHTEPLDYIRELDLKTGVSGVTYVSDGITFDREYFVSKDANRLFIRISADKPNAINVKISFSRKPDPMPWCHSFEESTTVGTRGIAYCGYFEEGISYRVDTAICYSDEATVTTFDTGVQVANADEVLIALSAEVDHDSHGCPVDANVISRTWDYGRELDMHLREHRRLYDRTTLCLEPNDEFQLPLMFHYGRYLLMSSSRSCRYPANLQGIWNEDLAPPWECDFHNDVNIQMNYWMAETCGLIECTSPLVSYILDMIPEGKKAAGDLFGCGGLYIPIQTDIWGKATPESPGWDVWTGAAAWLGRHLWDRYEYGQDTTFLREIVYPYYELVAEFYLDFLVRDKSGFLVTIPSQSPENSFVGGAMPVSLCIGATMDFILIREVLDRCLMASTILGIDEEKRQGWFDIISALPPYRIGKNGQLQEWFYDYDEVETDHRHLSHLYGLYPGESMTPDVLADKELLKAIETTLDVRTGSDSYSGWNLAWSACLWARLGNGDRALEMLTRISSTLLSKSKLHLIWDRVFNIDGNLGLTAAVAEMLLQSHGGIIRPIPALPGKWCSGRFEGLRARQGFLVDLMWRDHQIHEITLTSNSGNTCRIAIDNCPTIVNRTTGLEVVGDWLDNVLVFDTEPMHKYSISVVPPAYK